MKYTVLTSRTTAEDGTDHTVFGLASETMVMPDISCDRELVEGLCRRLNKYAVSQAHMMEVIEDAIAN